MCALRLFCGLRLSRVLESTFGDEHEFDRCTREQLPPLPDCIWELQSQTAGNQSYMLGPSLYFKHQNPRSLTRLAKYGEINCTLNPIKLERKTRVSGLVFFGGVADPDESEDWRGPSALEETRMDQNINDFLKQAHKTCACVCAQFKVFSLISLRG